MCFIFEKTILIYCLLYFAIKIKEKEKQMKMKGKKRYK